MEELSTMSHTEFLHWIAFYERDNAARAGKPVAGHAQYSLQGMTAVQQIDLLDKLLGK